MIHPINALKSRIDYRAFGLVASVRGFGLIIGVPRAKRSVLTDGTHMRVLT